MRKIKYLIASVFIVTAILILSSFLNDKANSTNFKFPYKQAGLTNRQAAAHLLSRFSYGAKAGDIDAVVGIGPEKWFQQQLGAKLPDKSLNKILSNYDAINLSNARDRQILHLLMKT